MPNGGSDNCGTCWFNRRNNGRYARAVPEGFASEKVPNECLLRGHGITTDPFHTYCANHPQHNADDGMVLKSQDSEGGSYFSIGPTVPIGPIWTMTSHASGRVVLVASPDSQYIREHLLETAEEMQPHNWPAPTWEREPHRWHMTLWQLGEFREQRAIPALKAVTAVQLPSSDVQHSEPLTHLFARRWGELQQSATGALDKIMAPAARRT